MDFNDLKQLKSLLEKLEQLESVEKLQKQVEELKEYKRRYLAIKGIIEWDAPSEAIIEAPIVEKPIEIKEEKEIECAYGIVNTNGRSYGETIRSERKIRHLSIEEVYKKSGVARGTIFEIENNIPRNNEKSKRRLEDYYGIRIVETDYVEQEKSSYVIDVSRIRETRKEKNMTLKDVYQMTGIPVSSIHEIENNQIKNINPIKVNKIKKALGMI